MDAADLATIRATYEVEPAGSAGLLAEVATTGRGGGPDAVRGRVVDEGHGVAVVDLPAGNFGASVGLLLSAVVGEIMELRALTRCRLIDLVVPPGLLPGPAFAAPDRLLLGAIVKPSLGLSPVEVGQAAAALARGGADLIKDDELLGDPEWCPLEQRVQEVMGRIPGEVTYFANVTGEADLFLHRAQRVVELGATGIMVNAFVQGLDAVRVLREADLGVPVLVHRAGSGPMVRNDRFGVSGAVLALLARLCGSDAVIVGAFGPHAAMFDDDAAVAAQIDACRRPLPPDVPASVAVLGGGLGPGDVAAQVQAAGGTGLAVLLGSAALRHPGGPEAAVREADEALTALRAHPGAP